MESVQFEEQQVPLAMRVVEPKSGAVTRLVIALHLARTVRDAQIVMIILGILFLGVSVYILFKPLFSGGGIREVPVTEREQFFQTISRTR